jgi:hypothetical protein
MTCSATAERITRALSGDWHGHYGTAPAPGHSKRDRSLSIRPHPTDPDDIIVHCFAGENWQEVKVDLRRRGLLNGTWKRSVAITKPRRIERREPDPHLLRQMEKARRTAQSGCQISGTIAETYLRRRGIACDLPSTLSFLPARKPEHHPALLAVFGLPDEPEPGAFWINRRKISGVHLTLLAPDGLSKVGTERDKFMVGPSAGWPIVLAPPNDGLALVIAEGIETALSMHQATGLGAWAAGSAGRMPPLANVIPDYVECVTIATEEDEAGMRGASELAGRLNAPGIEVLMAEANNGGA